MMLKFSPSRLMEWQMTQILYQIVNRLNNIKSTSTWTMILVRFLQWETVCIDCLMHCVKARMKLEGHYKSETVKPLGLNPFQCRHFFKGIHILWALMMHSSICFGSLWESQERFLETTIRFWTGMFLCTPKPTIEMSLKYWNGVSSHDILCRFFTLYLPTEDKK